MHFKKRMKDSGVKKAKKHSIGKSGKKRKEYPDGIGPERMPDEFFNKDGEFDLSQVPGEQARRYFERVLRIPMPPGISRISATDPEIQAAYGNKRR